MDPSDYTAASVATYKLLQDKLEYLNSKSYCWCLCVAPYVLSCLIPGCFGSEVAFDQHANISVSPTCNVCCGTMLYGPQEVISWLPCCFAPFCFDNMWMFTAEPCKVYSTYNELRKLRETYDEQLAAEAKAAKEVQKREAESKAAEEAEQKRQEENKMSNAIADIKQQIQSLQQKFAITTDAADEEKRLGDEIKRLKEKLSILEPVTESGKPATTIEMQTMNYSQPREQSAREVFVNELKKDIAIEGAKKVAGAIFSMI